MHKHFFAVNYYIKYRIVLIEWKEDGKVKDSCPEISPSIRELREKGIEVPEYYNFAYDVVDKRAQEDRNRLAMVWVNQQGRERKLTYFDFSRLSTQAANLLFKHGVSKGDRVFIMLPRIPEWWIFSLAIMKLGAVQCSSPSLLTSEDLKQRLQYGKFKVVITDLESAHKFDEIYDDCPLLNFRMIVDGERKNWISYPHEIKTQLLSKQRVKTPVQVRTKASDPLLLTFTSGTSKIQKVVQHNHAYPLGHRITAEMWHGLGPNDLHYSLSDAGWAKNLWGNYFGQWIVGCCVFIYDIRGKFNPDEILPILEKYQITSFCAPPTIYRFLIQEDLSGFDLSSLEHCSTAGEPLSEEVFNQWKRITGLQITEGFGQSETTVSLFNFGDQPVKPGSIGKPAPYYDIRLLDESGAELGDAVVGEICFKLDKGKFPATDGRFPGLVREYYGDPEKTAEAFHDGYYFTGDTAWRDEDGCYWFVGRRDDVIKCSGYRIGTFEVESVLMKHPAVLECAVTGAPDPVRGQVVKATIVLTNDYKPGNEDLVVDIKRFVKEVTAPYKYPRIVEFVDALPKTASGKILRKDLREKPDKN